MQIGFALSPTWLRGDSWRRAASGVERMFSLAPYADIARSAEAAGVDFLFAPDAGYLDPAHIDRAPGFSTLDSHTLVSALAALTSRTRLVPTVQSTFAAPYPVARQLQSLHQLSAGRAGWNLVTALGGWENFGLSNVPDSPTRYARAAEFVEVVTRLWSSFPAEALVMDQKTGVFADASKVKEIDFVGSHFRVKGPLATPAPAAPRPPLFTAGASAAAVSFAGRYADAVFGCAPELASSRSQREALRAAAVAAGRPADAVRFYPGLSFVLAETREEARQCAGSPAGGGPAHWTVIGTPEDALTEIRHWRREEGIDGFIALGGGSQESVRLFLEEVASPLKADGEGT